MPYQILKDQVGIQNTAPSVDVTMTSSLLDQVAIVDMANFYSNTRLK